MTGIYYVDAADWLRAVGLVVHEVDGWKTRARSSGGFPSTTGALGIQWHHTASSASPQSDVNFMFFNSGDRPVGNMLLDRNGEAWIGAAGAANTAGKGGPLTLSRGTLPQDGANARTWAIEAANNGVGEAWPTRQIDAYYLISNELNARFGNQPTDIFNHATWAPGRKIDPATATAVQGPWRPAGINTSGTWAQADVTTEAGRRASTIPTPPKPEPPTPPTPTPPPHEEDDDMLFMGRLDTNPDLVLIGNGVTAVRVRQEGWPWIQSQMAAGFSKWRQPQRAGFPLINSVDEITTFTAGQLRAAVGVELTESVP